MPTCDKYILLLCGLEVACPQSFIVLRTWPPGKGYFVGSMNPLRGEDYQEARLGIKGTALKRD